MGEKRPKLRDEASKGRYRPISTRIWNDYEFRALSDDAQLLFFFLLTHPETKPVPSLLRVRETSLIDERQWPAKRFRAAFKELSDQEMVLADWSVGLIFFPNAVKHDLPANRNVIIHWGRIMRNEMPECELLLRAIVKLGDDCRTEFAEEWASKAFAEAFPEPFLKGLRQRFAKRLPEQFLQRLPPENRMPVPLPDPDPLPAPPPAADDPNAATVADEPAPQWEGDTRTHAVLRWAQNADGCWSMIQLVRARWYELPRELVRPPGFDEWFARWHPLQGKDGIERTLFRYLSDAKIRTPAHPTAVLITEEMYSVIAVEAPKSAGGGA